MWEIRKWKFVENFLYYPSLTYAKFPQVSSLIVPYIELIDKTVIKGNFAFSMILVKIDKQYGG